MTAGTNPVWLALAASCRGSSHQLVGTENQDAYATLATAGATAVAVADGHGDPAHFRSRDGADFAVGLAVRLMSEAGQQVEDPEELSACLQGQVARQLVDDWRQRVLDHAVLVPMSPEKDVQLHEGGDLAILRVYGTTLVAVVATPVAVAFLQIGDGDAVAVFEDGAVLRPVPDDPTLDGIHTTSMSQMSAAANMRVTVLDLRQRRLRLALVATDGFASSQVDGVGWWRQVGKELAGHLRENGPGYIEQRLPGWLEEPAGTGGDDTTMGLLLSSSPER